MNVSQRLLTAVALALSARQLGAQAGALVNTYPQLKSLQSAVAGFRTGLDDARKKCATLTIPEVPACSTAVGKLRSLGLVLDYERHHIDPSIKGDERKRLSKALGEMADEAKPLKNQPGAWVMTQGEAFAADAAKHFRHVNRDEAIVAYLGVYDLGNETSRDLKLEFDSQEGAYVLRGSTGLSPQDLTAMLKEARANGRFSASFGWEAGDVTSKNELTLRKK